VMIDNVMASNVTFVNSTTLHVQVPARPSGSYPLYVVNPDGGTGIRVAGINYNASPTWVTTSPLDTLLANTFFGVNLSATGVNTYSLAAGSSLPAGTTLSANGYFSGTVTIGVDTTYSFDVVATDAELQDSIRTFQVTITPPQYRLFSWGKNNLGQLGLNNVIDRSSPTQVGANTNWSLVQTVSADSGITTKTDGTLWSWGYNLQGQLGLNDIVDRSSPVQVGTATNWNRVTGTISGGILATKTDGTLWVWGGNGDGQLGLNNVIYRSSPTQVGANTNWNRLNVNSMGASIATKTDGTLWTWGSGFAGVLGQNNNISRSSPTQVGTGTNWFLVSCGNGVNALATKTDGTLWSWGLNTNGQLGLNDIVNRSSPVQVGTATNWSQINVGRLNSMATTTDGTLWSWGLNTNGQLGLNDIVNRSSPVQVGSTTNWNLVSMTRYSAVTTKTNGTLWSWGLNTNGQLGLNDSVNRSSPTQVGANTTWTLIGTNFYSAFATR